MSQTNYNDMSATPAIEGMIADIGYDKFNESKTAGANVAQVATVTVDAATNSTLYTVIVNGVLVTFTSDASATIAEIHAGLLAAGIANSFLSGVVTFSGASPDLVITADVAGVPMTVTEADADLSLVATTANVTASPILFGRGLAQNLTDADLIALPSATGFTLAGVSMASQIPTPNDDGIAKYEDGVAVPVLKKGRIWVLAEDAVTSLADAVYLRHTANGAVNVAGRFRTDADTNRADVIANARWKTLTTAINQLAILEINLP